jgi:cytoskeletal protein CcmA (bactofilin family)
MKSFFGGSTQQRQDTMFSATATKTPEPALATPRGKTQMPSIFSTDLKITGDLVGDGEMQIDGHVDGNVKSTAVVIGKGGSIKGKIQAEQVVIAGGFDGQIRARDVHFKETAHVTGDITVSGNISIDKGAYFEGHCKRAAPADKVTVGKFGDKPGFEPAIKIAAS